MIERFPCLAALLVPIIFPGGARVGRDSTPLKRLVVGRWTGQFEVQSTNISPSRGILSANDSLCTQATPVSFYHAEKLRATTSAKGEGVVMGFRRYPVSIGNS